VERKHLDARPLGNSCLEEGPGEAAERNSTISQPAAPQALRVRAERAKLIEEISYRLTDLITIISARVELLSEKAPGNCLQDLQAIRTAAMTGVQFSKRLLQAAQDCRREVGL
jgi:hypothetical protein